MAILEEYSYEINSLKYRLKITNVFKKFIFLDDLDFLNHLNETDILVMAKDEIEFPSFKNNLPKDLGISVENDNNLPLNQTLSALLMIKVLALLGYHPAIFSNVNNYMESVRIYLQRVYKK
jgi:hypothetical protein